jgi:hypothetical protein
MEKLMPPLVAELRRKVKEFRDGGYVGAADTSRSLLHWWFDTPHLLPNADGTMAEFQYFFAQREALETIVYLYDVAGVKDKHDLMRFDASGLVSGSMFDGRNWRDDFQLTLHLQDEVRITRPTGNIFLTNIHRVYSGEDIPSCPTPPAARS